MCVQNLSDREWNWTSLSYFLSVPSSAALSLVRCYLVSSARLYNSFQKVKCFFQIKYNTELKYTFYAVRSVCMVNFQWNQNRLLYSCQNKLLLFYSFLTLPPIHVQDLKRKYYETCMILWFYYFRIDPKSQLNIRKICVNLSPIFKEGFHCLTFILEYKIEFAKFSWYLCLFKTLLVDMVSIEEWQHSTTIFFIYVAYNIL